MIPVNFSLDEILNSYILGSAVQVGEIPQGLPEFSVPKKFEYAKSLIPTTILITGVAILVREILIITLCYYTFHPYLLLFCLFGSMCSSRKQ